MPNLQTILAEFDKEFPAKEMEFQDGSYADVVVKSPEVLKSFLSSKFSSLLEGIVGEIEKEKNKCKCCSDGVEVVICQIDGENEGLSRAISIIKGYKQE